MILDFHFIQVVNHHNLKGSYLRNSGIEVYNKNGVEISVWISMDRRNSVMVFRYYGTYSICEC